MLAFLRWLLQSGARGFMITYRLFNCQLWALVWVGFPSKSFPFDFFFLLCLLSEILWVINLSELFYRFICCNGSFFKLGSLTSDWLVRAHEVRILLVDGNKSFQVWSQVGRIQLLSWLVWLFFPHSGGLSLMVHWTQRCWIVFRHSSWKRNVSVLRVPFNLSSWKFKFWEVCSIHATEVTRPVLCSNVPWVSSVCLNTCFNFNVCELNFRFFGIWSPNLRLNTLFNFLKTFFQLTVTASICKDFQ